MTKQELETEVSQASQALKQFPRGDMGLTPDAVKASPEWKAARARYQSAFAALRQWNAESARRRVGGTFGS